jgi:hypothetical protein
MKYTILFIASVGIWFAACKKKSTPTHCYVCTQYDSVLTRGSYLSHFNGVSDTQCEKNQGLMDFYVSTHVQYDTFYLNTDSQTTGYKYFRCEFLR